MLYIKQTQNYNGTHDNFTTSEMLEVDGYLIVPVELEAIALPLLPWVNIVVENGAITKVEKNVVAWEAWETEEAAKILVTPEPTIEQRTTALEATQSDVIDILASTLGVTI